MVYEASEASGGGGGGPPSFHNVHNIPGFHLYRGMFTEKHSQPAKWCSGLKQTDTSITWGGGGARITTDKMLGTQSPPRWWGHTTKSRRYPGEAEGLVRLNY